MLNQRVPLRDVHRGARPHTAGAFPTEMEACTDSCSFGKGVDLQNELLSALQINDIQLFSALLQKQDSDGNLVVNPDHQYGDPHYATCLELACKGESTQELIKVLLASNANPNNVNPVRNKAPIHIAVENHNHEALAALLQDQRTDINVVDNFGNTALHIAAKSFKKDPISMEICLKILISREDCKINKRNRKGRTALEEAANFGGRKAVEVILNYGKDKIDIDDNDVSDKQTVRDVLLKKFPDLELPLAKPSSKSDDHETLKTMLFKLLYFKKCEEFMQKLDSGATKDILDADDGKNTLLQYACECGLYDVAKYLLSKGANPNAVISTNRKPPVFQACSGGYYDILLLLLQFNANVAPVDGKTLLHCVVKGKQIKSDDSDRQYRKCFQLLLERKNELNLEINATDENGNTALHYAVKEKDQHYVKALLKHGAYIGLPNNFGYSPLADIDPSTFGDFLDDCITSNGKYRRDDKYELTFKYAFLEPPDCNLAMQSSEEHEFSSEDEESGSVDHYRHPLLPEMHALHYICKSEDLRPLLKHPVLLSFLYLKWSHIRMYFFANILLFGIFVTLLSVYVLKDCRGEALNATTFAEADEMKQLDLAGKSLLWVSLSIFLLGLVLREAFQLLMNPKRYFCSLDNYIEIILIGVTFAIVSENWGHPSSRVTHSIAILLSWTELFMQVGRIHSLSTYNEMMKRVLWNYTKFLVWDSLLIIAFALGFYTIFHEMTHKGNDDEINFFENPAMSLFKTIIMLTGEFDAGSLPFEIVPIVSYIIFILFIFLVPIVMVNLLHGLAVSDTQAIKEDAELVSIESLIELIFYFENMLLGDTVTNCFQHHCCWSQSFAQKFLNMHKSFTKFFLFPNTLRHKELSINPNFSHKIFISSNTVHPKQTQDTEEMVGTCCCKYIIVANCCTMDKRLLKTAMDIIDKKSDLSDRDVISRLESIETKVLKMQHDLNRLLNAKISNT